MMKKVWGRRRGVRGTTDGNTLVLPNGQSVRKRKKGTRRKRAATLLLGLSTIMPMPGAKLIHANGSKAKTKITVAGNHSKKRLEKGSIFSGSDMKGEVRL